MKKAGLLAIASIVLTMGIVACGGGETGEQSSSQGASSSLDLSSNDSSLSSSSTSSSSNSSSSSSSTSSSASSSSSSSSSSIHTHVYGNLIEEVLPSYFYDGKKSHYYCSECHQYFDVNKNPVTEESLKLPRSSDDVAISINSVEKGTFTLLEKSAGFVTWEYKNLSVAVDDVITLTKPGDPTYRYQYFGNGNVDEDGKVLTAGTVNLDLSATPNGFGLQVSGYKYPGLVVKVNDDEYPLTKVSYYEDNKETYVYGYHYFNIGDKMTVVDNINNIVYDYEDLENDTKWNKFDFHKGTNNEIVFDYQARFGVEFDRGGDKLISLTKTFAPNDGNAFQVNYSSDKAAVDLEKMTIGETHEMFEQLSWYLNHESVINNSDMKEYVNTHGYSAFYTSINFAKDEMFNLNNVTKNSVIKGEHLASIYADSLDGLVTISGDYIKLLKDASVTVFYAPFCDTISLYFSNSSSGSDAYVMYGGDFIPVSINNDIIEYNNFHADQYDSISFADASYKGIEFTLAPGYDSSVCFASTSSGTTVLMFFKAGTFSVSLNLSTHVLTVTIVELDGPAQTGAPKYLSGKGGLYKTLVDNPEDANEVYATGVNVTGTSSDTFYIAFYDEGYNSIEDLTCDATSSTYGSVMLGKMFYFNQDGSFNVYIHKTSHVMRLVKTA